MSGDLTTPVVLVGCGDMALAYADVLKAVGVPFTVIGRGEDRAAKFASLTGITPVTGGLDRALAEGPAPARAISTVDVPGLEGTVQLLLDHGVRDVLVEKPAALTPAGARALADSASRKGARIIVAYNRRYYASVREAARRIADAGGVSSVRFDFTERAAQIGAMEMDSRTKAAWLYANSTHVLDLAFHLAGAPVALSSQVAGALEWHPAGAVFSGHGQTSAGAQFSYGADWTGPGRWGVELVSRECKLFLQPLEELHVQEAGSFNVSKVEIDDDLDKRFKPGVYRQTLAFLTGEDDGALLGIEDHACLMDAYRFVLEGTKGKTVKLEPQAAMERMA